MKITACLIAYLALIGGAAAVKADSQTICVAPRLSNERIKEIVDQERQKRKDLPIPFPKFRWVVQRQACRYIYLERGLPETPEYNQRFTLNQDGMIVETQIGNAPPKAMESADRPASESKWLH